MNGFAKQILRFWNELGLNQKVSLSLAAAFVVAGMSALLFWSSTPQMVLLYGGMDGKDMAEVVKTLDEQTIPYEIRPGNSVFIAKENVYKVRMELASQGIPNGGSIGYEIFDRTNFGVSDFVQRTNYIRAMQGELQRTIAQLRGVRSARVMIVIPQNRLMVSNEPSRATASVMIDSGGKTIEEDAVNSIRFLVANSVEGLASNDVVVVDANGKALSQDLAQDNIVGAASGQFKFRKNLEDYFTRKVETMLARIVGPQNVVARVSVELDTEATTVTADTYDPNGQVVRNQSQTDEVNRTSEVRTNSGVVGVAANTPDAAAAAPAEPSNNSEESRKNKSVSYEISHSRVETVKAPGGVNRVSAAVFIARRYTGEGAERVENPRSADELEQIRQMIVQAIGVEEPQGSPVPLVTLAEADFVPQVDLAEESQPDMVETIFSWVEMLRNFIAVGVAAIIFLVFLRILKRHKPESYSLEIMDEDISGGKKGSDVAPRLTPELLNELIREKPENVSTALRNWALESGKK
ncbi:MAG: flagellar M-ring protein FliF [Opitutales bacterium]|nr:flagellar M-ring protein FliF [Opitutales bacterium]